MLLEHGTDETSLLNDSLLEQEAKVWHLALDQPASELGATYERYKLSWEQALFMPTRINRPRKTKKARSIRKRLAKRLVRVAGRRF